MPKYYKQVLITAVAAAGLLLPAQLHAEDYSINFDKSTTIDISQRHLNAVSLSSPSFGAQSIDAGQATDKLFYHDNSTTCFVAQIGETVSPGFNWTGNWMHGYVYLDKGNDGQFDWPLDENKNLTGDNDAVAFSNYNGKSSDGTSTNNGNVGVNPPAFVIPADLAPGIYRMRFKVDWNSIDPGGNDANGPIHQQLITNNNGAIVDVSVFLTTASFSVSVDAPHGKVLLSDNTELTADNFTPGQELPLQFVPDEGYVLSSVTTILESGIEVPDGYTPSAGINAESVTTRVPGFLIKNNRYTIPASSTRGQLTIKVDFVQSDEPAEGNYESVYEGTKDAAAGFSALTISGRTAELASTDLHGSLLDVVLPATQGEPFDLSAVYAGDATEFAFYIDCTQNGVFSAAQGECFATASAADGFSAIDIPAAIPAGVYRARLEAKGHCDVDFLLNLRKSAGEIDVKVFNALVLTDKGNVLPNTTAYGAEIGIKTTPVLDGFVASALTVRHGQQLNGPQYVMGNKQWDEIELEGGGVATIPAEAVDGDILIMGNFAESPDSEWTYIWGDEFDSNELDSEKWSYQGRASSTWSKNIAKGNEIPYVNKFSDGRYNAYAIGTPEEFAATETQEMITGALNSAGKFYLTGGRVEARIRNRAHAGNFPAFWMMPQKSSGGWPVCGEIDIWEQIDASKTTYHTIHDGWRYKSLGTVSRNAPSPGGTSTADGTQWHVYALEWDASEELRWYLDGKLVFTYTNQHFTEGAYTAEVTWPYNKAFYVIINQSVGDGSWAAKGDPSFEYLTEFDYVRCYQRKDALNYYSTADGNVSSVGDVIFNVGEGSGMSDAEPVYYDLLGVRVDTEKPQPGVYIEHRGDRSRKVVIR